jgi:hypothetical protein
MAISVRNVILLLGLAVAIYVDSFLAVVFVIFSADAVGAGGFATARLVVPHACGAWQDACGLGWVDLDPCGVRRRPVRLERAGYARWVAAVQRRLCLPWQPLCGGWVDWVGVQPDVGQRGRVQL